MSTTDRCELCETLSRDEHSVYDDDCTDPDYYRAPCGCRIHVDEDFAEHLRDLHSCEWYAFCDNGADGVVDHPVLGPVPTCRRCADRHGLTFVEVER